jgi:hypothetical protein
MSNKTVEDENAYYAGVFSQAMNQVKQWYTVAMYELKVDPTIISAIGRRVEELADE